MKKRIVFLSAIVVLGCILCTPAAALASGANAAASATYRYFESYDVKIVVRENNVLDVTETIVADYDVLDAPGHGIIREIPTELDFTYPDGTSKLLKVVLSDIQVPRQPFTTGTDGAYRVLQIGDPNEYATGKVTYTIKYKMDIGSDYYSEADFLYYNIIGTEWNADIKNASFTVQMPKAFDSEDVYAYLGKYGSTTALTVSISGNTISGTAQNLEKYQGISLIVDLPEGYFVGARVGPPFLPILLGIFALLAAASVILFLLFGRDKKVVQTVEFSAPDDLTSAEVGYVIDGSVDNKDVTSLIIYWADKGYLTLTEQGEKDDILLTKIKELPQGAKAFEKTMFAALFKKGDSVSVLALQNTFYTTMESTKTQVKNSFKAKRSIFTKMSITLQGLMGFFAALPIALSFLAAIQYDSGSFMAAGVFSFVVLGLLLAPVYMLISLVKTWRSLEAGKRIVRLLLSLVLLSVVFTAYLALMWMLFESLLLGIASVAATMLIAFCAMFIRKKTEKGTELMGKILGLRNFIEKAEKERIEKLVEENPNYFYSVLPYAYVLGVTDKWAKNFERIGLQPPPPTWYYGYGNMNLFSTMMFMHMINNSMHSINTSFVSRPAPKGGSSGGFGGGFGGGGFSGGGFGGGGGGGW